MTAPWNEKLDNIQQKHIVIPNAKVNKPYYFLFDIHALGLQDMGDYQWLIPDDLGITFDNTTAAFNGIPQQAGEFTLTLQFRLHMAAADQPFAEKQVRLIINPDPKSLWKDLPSDQSDPYWQADTAAIKIPFGDRQLLIASKRGRSHAHEGKFRDDSFAGYFDAGSGWGIIAVADGAGSAKYSRKGAAIACDTVVAQFKELVAGEKMAALEDAISAYLKEAGTTEQTNVNRRFTEQLGQIALDAQKNIKQEAQTKGADLKDYSTTLIFAIVKKYDAGYVISSFWVGDGGIGIYDEQTASVTVLGTPDSGEFAGQTRFLTMQEIFADGAYANRIRFKVVPAFTALLLMTDGITDPKFQTDANLHNIALWKEVWEDLNGKNDDNCPALKSEADLLNWLDFWSPGNHDDRTIAILY